jgi:hypothetical protein
MSTRPVDAAAGSAAVAQAKPVKPQAATSPRPSSNPAATRSAPTAASSVRISAAALAALKEATETPAQTAQEARGGDRAALHLEAKAAERAAEFKK